MVGRSWGRALGAVIARGIAFALFVAALILWAFLLGIVVGKQRSFPYPLIERAAWSVGALRQLVAPVSPLRFEVAEALDGTVRHDAGRAFQGVTFMTDYRDGVFQGLLVDMAGRVLHRWRKRFGEVWPEAPHIAHRADDGVIFWDGSHLYGNGDLLINFEGGNVPFGGGLVRLDRESRVVWRLARNTHHDISVGDDGRIYVAAHRLRTEPLEGLIGFRAPFYEDLVLVVDAVERAAGEDDGGHGRRC